ncbi:hypothetical protein [Sinorhizobium mexicanum]|uniref:Uncharacterized protein n=1 Tax=Sinorhizobium mexicanum TaxID=375549 RepID=A0A859R057_9HYPH|nr:hypothetical protein [Sinorhizobium mexicanum]MBP1884359.1 hypothetical protein [Sinorhizobium mexicanum]QLL65039.1 hypothetical protein FKV68_27110 [Sinorhizobium mexicanum]
MNVKSLKFTFGAALAVVMMAGGAHAADAAAPEKKVVRHESKLDKKVPQPFWVQIPPSKETLESTKIPRTADGLPNIFAEWVANWRTIAPDGREPRELRPTDRIKPEDFASKEKYMEFVNRDMSTNPANRCIPSGGARIVSSPYKLEIVRTEEGARHQKVVFLNEQYSIIRRAYVGDFKIQPNQEVRGQWGASNGEWQDRSGDGKPDTFFVKTTGLNGSWLEQPGLTYDDGTEFTEEYWLSEDGNTLHMLETITDPKTYSKPIKHHIWWSRAKTDAEAVHDEYICYVESATPELLLLKYNSAKK